MAILTDTILGIFLDSCTDSRQMRLHLHSNLSAHLMHSCQKSDKIQHDFVQLENVPDEPAVKNRMTSVNVNRTNIHCESGSVAVHAMS